MENQFSLNNFHQELSMAVIGASDSIEILCPPHDHLLSEALGDIFFVSDGRLALRSLISLPKRKTPGKYFNLTGVEWELPGWNSRIINSASFVSCCIVDADIAFLIYYPNNKEDGYVNATIITDKLKLRNITDYFEYLWGNSDNITILYDNFLYSSFPNIEEKLIIDSKQYWDKFIENLQRDFSDIHSLHHRKFEELVAELLDRDGFSVKLTPATRDGGYDIWASKNTEHGNNLYLVECKKNNPKNPVGVQIIRSLYGLVELHKASKGLIVTTSRFTKDAILLKNDIEYRMALKDYEALSQWISRIAKQSK